MTPPDTAETANQPTSAAFIGDASTATMLPAEIVEELGLSDDEAALIYPTWDAENLEIGFQVEFADEAGPGISGRQLNKNETSGGVQLRFPRVIAKLTGLESQTKQTDALLRYDVDAEQRTLGISVEPSLMPTPITDAEHDELGEEYKDSGFTPSRSADGVIQSIRYEVPVDYARGYGFEPQREVGLKLALEDGSFAVAIDLEPDPDDPNTIMRSMNYYGESTQTEDMYAITIPKVVIHALRWWIDMPIRSVPLEDHILLLPANPIGDVDGRVTDESVIDELAGEPTVA